MIATACLESGLPPAAFLDHPEIGLEILLLLEEERKASKSQELRGRLRQMVRGG